MDEQEIPYPGFNLVWPLARSGDRERAAELLAPNLARYGLPVELASRMIDAYLRGEPDPVLIDAIEDALAGGTMPLANAIWASMIARADPGHIFDWASGALKAGKLNQIGFLDPDTAPYRQDPRFLQLMEEIGLAAYWRTVELPDFCRDESVAGLCP